MNDRRQKFAVDDFLFDGNIEGNCLLPSVIARSVAGLINMARLHSLKTRHEQQKEPDYLKKDPIIFGIPVKK